MRKISCPGDKTIGAVRFIHTEWENGALMAFEGELLALLPRLRRFAAGLSRNAADGDDLCQAALERALKSRHLWAEGTRLDSWMYRIMRNIWIDEARARQRRAKTFAPEEEGEKDRKSTRLNPVTNAHLVCRLLLE